jgi:cysteine-rich repeat protein
MAKRTAMERIGGGRVAGAIALASALAGALVLNACDPQKPTGRVRLTTGVVQICPVVTAITILPLEVLVGGTLDVSADMTDGAPDWIWTATAGHFDNPSADHTLYHCDLGGAQVLTFTLIDGTSSCADSVDVRVMCSYSPFCGDGKLDRGEQCDDGNTQRDDGCSARCFREPLQAQQ